jgi:hypothetical protein
VAPLPELFEFDPDAPAGVVGCMRELITSRNGWVNMQPLVEEEDIPQTSVGILGWISAKGPAVPEATWVPGERRRNGSLAADSIGLQHRGGPRARAALAEAGVPIPAGWKLLSDHPKRGLVIELPADTEPDEIVHWLVAAARVLSPMELPSRGVAAVPRRG